VQFAVGGTLTDPDGNTATVTITKADGTALYTGAATTRQSQGTYRKVLTPADTTEVNLLTATWAATFSGAADQVVTYAEVVGDHLFTLGQARGFNPRGQTAAPLASSTTYPDDAVLDARARISDEFELICGTSFFPRYGRVRLQGSGRRLLLLPARRLTSVLAVTVGGTAFTSPELADLDVHPDGTIVRSSGALFVAPPVPDVANVTVDYVYGYQRVPGAITRAALLLLVSQLAGTDISPRALTLTDESGTMTLATAGLRGAWYGLPEVDSVLDRYRRSRIPGIA
jgi:hypothetical protein